MPNIFLAPAHNLPYRNYSTSSSFNSGRRLSVFGRSLLCLLIAFAQPFAITVQGQSQVGYEEFFHSLNDAADPNHGYAIAQITTVPMSLQEALSAVGPLVRATREPHRRDRRNARYSLDILESNLAKRGVSVAPALIKLFEDKDSGVCEWAARGLLELREAAIPDLKAALVHPNPQVRIFAMFVLSANGQKAETAVGLLQRIMETDPNPYVKVDAAIAITQITRDTSTIPVLRQGLQDQAEPERVSRSVDALAQFGVTARAQYPFLVDVLLNNPDPGPRGSAAHALVSIDAPATKVVAPLISALNSEKNYYGQHLSLLSQLDYQSHKEDPCKQEDESYKQEVELNKTFDNVVASASSRSSIADALIQFRAPIKLWRQPLIELLRDPEQVVTLDANDGSRRIDAGSDIASKLPQLGKSAVPELVSIFNEENSARVQSLVIKALGGIGSDAREAIPALIAAMKDPKHEDIREEVVDALGLIGPAAPGEVLPVLTEAVASHVFGIGVNRTAAKGIKKIAHALEDQGATEYISLLNRAVQSMSSDDVSVKEDAEEVGRSVTRLRQIWWESLGPAWFHTHKKLVVIAAIPPVLLLLWLVVLWWRPLWLLEINESLTEVSDVRLPSWLGGIALPIRYVLLVGFFQYHRRVLDAWVAARADKVRKLFSEKSTVREHSIHVPIPISLNDVALSDAGVADLRQAFDEDVGCLLIKGDGGTGKTSFACFIAQWAVSARVETRLCKHIMLPVLVEPEATLQFNSEDEILKFVQTQLKLLASDAEPPNLNLVKHLLRRKRILVIVDSLSEMKDEARTMLSASIASLPINAALITSRNDEPLHGGIRDVVVMSRIEGNFLSDFLGSYLNHLHKRQLFDDEEFFEACRRLTLIAGGRDITVLLAKLYADHMVMSKECNFNEDAPQNVPELFLQYVNRVNRMAAVDTFDDTVVQRVAKLVAWECLKEHFVPTTINREEMILSLGGHLIGPPLIRHLEEKLKIVRTVGVQRDRLRFTLDPLAEYLACLYIVSEYKADEARWQQLLERIRMSRVTEIRFFLLALQDCCTVNVDGHVPAAVIKELSEISGWDHGLEREKQRIVLINRLTRDLRMLDRKELHHVQKNLAFAQN